MQMSEKNRFFLFALDFRRLKRALKLKPSDVLSFLRYEKIWLKGFEVDDATQTLKINTYFLGFT